MKPKERENGQLDDTLPLTDQDQLDHELFLQAFEKPTQIYRFLRTRNLISPIFLNRNCSYFKLDGKERKNIRNEFRVDDILKKIESKYDKSHHVYSYKSEFLNITFDGFFDNELLGSKCAQLEVSLLKMCHKKRKDASSPFLECPLGKINVACNPDNISPSKVQALAIGSSHFTQGNNGHAVRSYVLLLKLKCEYDNNNYDRNAESVNGHISTEDVSFEGDNELSRKRRRLCGFIPNGNSDTSLSPYKDKKSGEVHYGAELLIYDKHKRCQLIDGDYEVAVQELVQDDLPKYSAKWETVLDGKVIAPFEVFNVCPTLKFKLSWSSSPLQGTVESPHHAEYISNMNCFNTLSNKSNDSWYHENGFYHENLSPRKFRIFYQFCYNNDARQLTEASSDLHCPWCRIHCRLLYGLLKHLRTCHPRFTFIYHSTSKGGRIDVSINDNYDGSYVGNPQDLHSFVGYAFSRSGPIKRTPVTQIIVHKPKTLLFDLNEFQEPEVEYEVEKEYIQGHNRLYYHTVLNTPIRIQDIEDDSEAETDPMWLRQKTALLIDDFTDVNEGEKEVMKIWNLHVMHHNYIGDCHLPTACLTFVEEHGSKVLLNNLTNNFLLHLVNLYDFGLIRSRVIFNTVTHLYQLHDKMVSEGYQLPKITTKVTSLTSLLLEKPGAFHSSEALDYLVTEMKKKEQMSVWTST